MKLIKLSPSKHGQFYAQVDDEDFEYLNQFKWHLDKKKENYYAVRYVGKKENGGDLYIQLHREVMKCKYKDGKMIDHKDRDGLNCQKSNLRFATKSQNSINSKNRGLSHFKGVSIYRATKINKRQGDCWKAQITIGKNKRKGLGYFKTEIEAAKAYNEAAKIHYGEFANLNII